MEAELTFTPIEMKVPAATWREILAAKMGKIIVWVWVLFWFILLLCCCAPTIKGIFRNPKEVPGTLKNDCCESLSTKIEILGNLVEELVKIPEVMPEKIVPEVAKPEKIPVKIPEVEGEKTRSAPSRKNKSATLTSDLKAGSKEGLAREPEYVINENMRAILVDWLIEVHRKFELRQETLYLTINIVNEFLSMKEVPRKELQLVGIASMLIACRYEDLAPEVNDVLQMSEEAYEREQVLAMEKAILGKLLCYWTVPTPYMLLSRYVKASVPVDFETEKVVYFFAELGMMNYFYSIKYPPSLLTASSVYAARSTLNYSLSWTKALEHYTGYSEDQLKEYARLLASFYSSAPDYRLKH